MKPHTSNAAASGNKWALSVTAEQWQRHDPHRHHCHHYFHPRIQKLTQDKGNPQPQQPQHSHSHYSCNQDHATRHLQSCICSIKKATYHTMDQPKHSLHDAMTIINNVNASDTTSLNNCCHCHDQHGILPLQLQSIRMPLTRIPLPRVALRRHVTLLL